MRDFQCNTFKNTLNYTIFDQTNTFPTQKIRMVRPFLRANMVSQKIQGLLGWGWTSWAERPLKNLSMVFRGSPLALLEGGEGGGWRLIRKKNKQKKTITISQSCNVYCANQQLRVEVFSGISGSPTFCFCLYFLVQARDGFCLQNLRMRKERTQHQLQKDAIGAK